MRRPNLPTLGAARRTRPLAVPVAALVTAALPPVDARAMAAASPAAIGQ